MSQDTYDAYAVSLGLPTGFVEVGPFGPGGHKKAQDQCYRVTKTLRGRWRIYCPSGREGMFALTEDPVDIEDAHEKSRPVERATPEAAIEYLATERQVAWALEAKQRAQPSEPWDPVPQLVRGLETQRQMIRDLQKRRGSRKAKRYPNPDDLRLRWAEDGPTGIKLTDEQRRRLYDARDADDVAHGRTPEPRPIQN